MHWVRKFGKMIEERVMKTRRGMMMKTSKELHPFMSVSANIQTPMTKLITLGSNRFVDSSYNNVVKQRMD
jgi:hypothetical protein